MTADLTLERTRCGLGIDGINGQGRGVRVLLQPTFRLPGGRRPQDSSYPNWGIILIPDLGGNYFMPHEVGHLITGTTGLNVFGEREGQRQTGERNNLNEAFSDVIADAVFASGEREPTPADGVYWDIYRSLWKRQVRAGPTTWAGADFDALDEHDTGDIARRIQGGIAALVTGTTLPTVPGCAAPPEPGARFFGDTLREMSNANGGNPTYADWCEAASRVGERAPWTVGADAIREVFVANGVPCDTPDAPASAACNANPLTTAQGACRKDPQARTPASPPPSTPPAAPASPRPKTSPAAGPPPPAKHRLPASQGFHLPSQLEAAAVQGGVHAALAILSWLAINGAKALP